jgi:putative transposase
MYKVRKLYIGTSEQLNTLSLASGELYSKTVTFFWRIVRKKGIWLKPSSLMRALNDKRLHAHTADAVVQSFCESLKSWKARRNTDINAKPPKRRRKFFKILYKNSVIRLKDGKLILSNGKGNAPLVFSWQWELPKNVEIGWNGKEYEIRAIYSVNSTNEITGDGTAGIDLGEIHTAVVYDGKDTTIYNGRLLRAKRQYQNKTKAAFAAKMDVIKKGGRKWKKLKKAKQRILKRLNNQIKDILHKQTTHIVSTLKEKGVHTLVVGDLRDIRDSIDYGKKANQKLHQWTFGKVTQMLKYKWEQAGGLFALQDESYTSQECPKCRKRNKPVGRVYKCKCGFIYHRDGVGSINIRAKYLGEVPVIGDMAQPAGIRYNSHLRCLGGVYESAA